MEKFRYQIFAVLVVAIILVSGLAACDSSNPSETGIPEATLTPSPQVTETTTLFTETPVQSEKTVILLTSPDAESLMVSRVQESLESLAAETGLIFAIQEGTSLEVPANTSVLVALGQDIDVNALAASYPEVSFVAVDNNNAAPSGNLSVIGDPVIDQRRRAFMAGYLAALISEDYKVAALVPSEANTTEAALESFVIGVRFFCGICQTKYPPFQTYPQWDVLPVDGPAETYQPVLDNFENQGIEILYMHGDLISPSIMTAIAERGILVVGDQRPEASGNNYVGTVFSDPVPVLKLIWMDIISGNSDQKIPASTVLVDRNPDHVSEGRFQLFIEMVEDLQAGLIYPEAVP